MSKFKPNPYTAAAYIRGIREGQIAFALDSACELLSLVMRKTQGDTLSEEERTRLKTAYNMIYGLSQRHLVKVENSVYALCQKTKKIRQSRKD